MNNLENPLSQFNNAVKILRQKWEHSKTLWKDQVGHKFERDYWQVIDDQNTSTIRAMDKLSKLITQARRSVK